MEFTNDYREILRQAFANRRGSNPRYSLRAFSRDLKVSSARLSEVLSGKKGLSRASGAEIARRLGYEKPEVERFCDLVESVDARSDSLKRAAQLRLQKLENSKDPNYQMRMDVVQALSEWYHFAILALSNLPDFRSDEEWIAKTLRIKPEEARTSIERLIRLSLLVEKNGRLQAVSNRIDAPAEAAEALQKFHRELLKKADEAYGTQSADERDSGTMFLIVDSSRFADAKKKLKKLRERFAVSVGAGKPDKLYCLSTHFFRVSENS